MSLHLPKPKLPTELLKLFGSLLLSFPQPTSFRRLYLSLPMGSALHMYWEMCGSWARNMWRIQPLGFRKSSAQTLALSCIYTSSSLLASPCPCSCPCPDHYVSFAFLILLGYPTRTWICPTAWTDLPSYFPTSHFLSLSLCLISLMILAPDQLYGTSGLAVEWRLWLHLALVYEPAKTNIGWMNERLIERMPPPLMISLTCMSNSRCCFRAWETCPFRARWALDDCWVCSLHVVRTLKLCSSVFPTSWKHELPNAALEK